MVPSVGGNLVVFPPNVPTMEVVEIAGRAVDPGAGPVTVPASLPVNTESTVHVWSGPGIR